MEEKFIGELQNQKGEVILKIKEGGELVPVAKDIVEQLFTMWQLEQNNVSRLQTVNDALISDIIRTKQLK